MACRSVPDRIIVLYLAKEFGGGGRYTETLIDALGRIGVRTDYVSFFGCSKTLGCDHVRAFQFAPTTGGWIGAIRRVMTLMKEPGGVACVAADHRSVRLVPFFKTIYPTAPWVYVVHTSPALKEDFVRRQFRKVVLRFTDGIAAVAQHILAGMRSRGYGKPGSVVYCAVPEATKGTPGRAEDDEGEERLSKPVVLLPGRVTGGKGHRDLVEASKGQAWEVWFAGDGDLLGGIREQCAHRGDVRFLGWVEQMSPVYEAASVVVLPSLSEGLSLSLMEAMAHGRPVVAYDIGPQRELIENGVTGVLVPVGDVEALGRAIQGLLDDKPRAEEMGRRAQRHVRERFTLERMANDTLALIERLRTPRRRSAP